MGFGPSHPKRSTSKTHELSAGPAFVPQLWRRVSLGRGALGRFFLEAFVPRNLADGDELRRALITAAVASLFVLIGPTYAALIWLLEEPPPLYYALAGWAFLTAASSLALLRGGKTRASAWSLLVGITAAVLVTVVREGGRSQAASNFVMVVVMAGLLVGWRGVVGLGVPVLVLLVALSLAERQHLFQPASSERAHGVFAVMQLLAVTVMLAIFDRVRLGLLRAQAELETKLLQSQRLEAIGRLAGGVAHDFNNLLTVILASVGDLAEGGQPVARSELADIEHAALRASELTRQLLAFSRRQRLAPRTFDLGLLLAEDEAMLARLLPENIVLEVVRPPTPIWLHADPGQISQVLLNLAANARDAMPGGGTLRIELLRDETGELGRRLTPTGPTPSAEVLLRVADTGVGMDAETLEKAFEPFFTTKAQGAGTGLGLATVHGIVLQSGGSVRVKSRPGRGTEFVIRFPEAAPPEDPQALPGRAPQTRPLASRRILLVEDDRAVRGAIARALEASGHRVVTCAGISEAAARWSSESRPLGSLRSEELPFDLIVSDVVMPEGSGLDLVRRLLAQHPTQRPRVLFVSGYPDGAMSDPMLGDAAYLAKPFTRDELARKVGEVLGAPAPPLMATGS